MPSDWQFRSCAFDVLCSRDRISRKGCEPNPQLYIIVHVRQGIKGPPVEVSVILNTNGAGVSADVC